MRPARLFLSQSILDRWLSDGTADVSGDTLTIQPDDRRFDLKTAVLFEKEVTESGDPHGLVGKVKDLEQLAELGGDYSAGTVIIGDEAYEVTDGFAGAALQPDVLPGLASLPPEPNRKTDPDALLAGSDRTAVGATSPGATSPGATSPGASSPGATSSGATSSGATSAGATSADATSADAGPGAVSAAGDLAAAIGSATGSSAGGAKSESELDLLARFFLEKH